MAIFCLFIIHNIVLVVVFILFLSADIVWQIFIYPHIFLLEAMTVLNLVLDYLLS